MLRNLQKYFIYTLEIRWHYWMFLKRLSIAVRYTEEPEDWAKDNPAESHWWQSRARCCLEGKDKVKVRQRKYLFSFTSFHKTAALPSSTNRVFCILVTLQMNVVFSVTVKLIMVSLNPYGSSSVTNVLCLNLGSGMIPEMLVFMMISFWLLDMENS